MTSQPTLKSAQSLAEFVAIVEALVPVTGEGLWFRGQSNASQRLTPGALRELDTITDGLGRAVPPGTLVRASGGLMAGPSPELALADFKRRAVPFLDVVPRNDFEWMFIAQHYGLRTRLLDWSTNALAALFFAASTAQFGSEDGVSACEEFEAGDEFRGDGFAVFVIDPGQINEAAHNVPAAIDIAADAMEWAHYLDPVAHGTEAYSPVCVTAPHIAPRIRAQSGTFTLHGSNVHPLDYYDVLRPMITKIFLPSSSVAKIRNSLRLSGITAGFIYPGLDTISKDINADQSRRYSWDKRKCREIRRHYIDIERPWLPNLY